MRYFRAILLTIICVSSVNCGTEEDTITAVNWKILYQDRTLEDLPGESEWQPVHVPSAFKFPHRSTKEFNFVWLKGEFIVRDDPSAYCGLTTGKIKYSDRIYINSRLIGASPAEDINWNPLPRNYIIPPGIVKKGGNTVYIRLGLYKNYLCGILGDVKIQRHDDFQRSRFINDLIYRYAFIGIVFLLSGILMLAVSFYIWNREEKLNFYASFLILLAIIRISISLPSTRFMSFETFHAVQLSIIPLMAIIHILLFQSIYRVFLSRYNRILVPLILSFIPVIVISIQVTGDIETAYLLKIATIAVCVAVIPFMLRQMHSINPDRFILFTLILFSFFAAAFISLETYYEITGEHYSDALITITLPVFVFFFALLISRENMKRRQRYNLLYARLQKIEDNKTEKSITDIAEEKLQKVIRFIDENYTSSISREGLAAAIDMNADYMSRMFKLYNGMKINEYINKLRVEEAVKRLDNQDLNITDIAFAVGFDSIATFIRAFKKITGKTPSEYREEI